MIGSKGKVAKTEIMKEEGYSEEQIGAFMHQSTKIGAEMPEEIAISIAAEMIAIKNHETEKYDFKVNF